MVLRLRDRFCQRRMTQAPVDVYIANMISYDNHWQRLQLLEAYDLCYKTNLSA